MKTLQHLATHFQTLGLKIGVCVCMRICMSKSIGDATGDTSCITNNRLRFHSSRVNEQAEGYFQGDMSSLVSVLYVDDLPGPLVFKTFI